jgi:hypothetical protein
MKMSFARAFLFAGATITLANCNTMPADVAATDARTVGAPTPLELPISVTEADRILSRIEKSPSGVGETAENIVSACPGCRLEPDLTAVEDDRDQWLYAPGYGWYPGDARGFDVKNVGVGNAGSFHVAVLQGSASYGFDVSGLAAGASEYFQITRPSYLGPACGTTAVIIVNPYDALPETNYNNNVATVAGLCNL